MTHKLIALAALMLHALGSQAAEVVYRIVEYNKSTAEFTLAACGMVPKGAWAYLENDYGATTGNRYNQIPRNRKATLYLEGWQGCTVRSITLGMCSNSKSGQAGLTVKDGETAIYTQRPADFASQEWFGQWVSKDLNVYVDIPRPLTLPAFNCQEASITLQGGTSEGSVYLDAITIEYDEAPGMELESPLGWTYEKLTKKSTLKVGDEVMMFRNGCAAADLDGMATSHYLDALPLASTTDVTSHEVLRFTLGKAQQQGMWTLTNQHGQLLGATGKQTLAWDEGETSWQLSLGYDGATITSANSKYGTMRFNAPEGSYARFNLYTSTSLPLPHLYRKDKQREPELCRSLTLAEGDMEVSMDEGQVALHATMMPASTTDRRVKWTSSNSQVASVNGGLVTLLSPGEATITAKSHDGGAETSIRLTVTEGTGIYSTTAGHHRKATYKVLKGHQVIIRKGSNSYTI